MTSPLKTGAFKSREFVYADMLYGRIKRRLQQI